MLGWGALLYTLILRVTSDKDKGVAFIVFL